MILVIALDLTKQQPLDADPKGIQQIKFTENLEGNATMFFVFKEVKEIILEVSQENMRVL